MLDAIFVGYNLFRIFHLQIKLNMKKQYLAVFFLPCFTLILNSFAVGQSIKKDSKNNTVLNVQSSTNVSIFQVYFAEVDENLERFLTKNQTVLHFKSEGDLYVIYLPEGNTKPMFIDLLKSNDITQFEILRNQTGSRKQNLFNKKINP